MFMFCMSALQDIEVLKKVKRGHYSNTAAAHGVVVWRAHFFWMICRSLSWICKVWGAASGRQSQHWRKIWSVDVWRWIQPSGSHLCRPWTMDGFRWLGQLGDAFTARSLCGWPRKLHNILNRPCPYCPRFGYLMIFGSLGSLGNHDVSGCFKYMIVWIFRYGVGMLKPQQIAKACVRVFSESQRFTEVHNSTALLDAKASALWLSIVARVKKSFRSFQIIQDPFEDPLHFFCKGKDFSEKIQSCTFDFHCTL